MNDDENAPHEEDTTDSTECDPTTAPSPCTTDDRDGNFLQKDRAISDCVLQDSASDSDSDSAVSDSIGSGDELEQLRSELRALRNELDARDTLLSRLNAECKEFEELYPEVSLASLDEKIWENVRHGIPIAAAFALSERKRLAQTALAEKSNLANRQRSAGAVAPLGEEYFSPDEVRAMNPTEVRQNYEKIMKSMKTWR